MFVGYTLTGSSNAMRSFAPTKNDYQSLTVKNAVYDYVFATVNVIKNFDGTVPEDWTFDTRLYAVFNGDLYGGNVSFTEEIVESIRIKRRTKNDNNFKTIFEKEINANEDFQIEFVDYLEPIGTVEYAYVPVISGGESDYITSSVESEFEAYFLCEKDRSYQMIMNAEYSQEINYETSNVKPLDKRYPVTIVNGNTGYKSGSMTCTFIELVDCTPNVGNVFDYRNLIYNMLTNKQPKILKDHEGNILMINITDNITEDNRQYLYQGDEGFYYFTSTFNWVECGDPYSIGDLYDNNLIDTELDRNT